MQNVYKFDALNLLLCPQLFKIARCVSFIYVYYFNKSQDAFQDDELTSCKLKPVNQLHKQSIIIYLIV